MTDLPIRCQCGQTKAVSRKASPRTTNRVVCCCKFCQSYVRHLGCAAQVLDEWGGTEVVQVRPSSIEFLEGQDQLACLHLSKTGARRWYTRCCKTPIANTMARGNMPFVGLLAYTFDTSAMEQSLDEVLGPVRVRVNGDFGGEAKTMSATRWDTARMMMHFGPMFASWWVQGEQRRSPFFRPDGEPIVAPERVKIAE